MKRYGYTVLIPYPVLLYSPTTAQLSKPILITVLSFPFQFPFSATTHYKTQYINLLYRDHMKDFP